MLSNSSSGTSPQFSRISSSIYDGSPESQSMAQYLHEGFRRDALEPVYWFFFNYFPVCVIVHWAKKIINL